ncbi:hypothetical protein P2318_12240 [Myxococcaceae bacterium GXIMD 01537]
MSTQTPSKSGSLRLIPVALAALALAAAAISSVTARTAPEALPEPLPPPRAQPAQPPRDTNAEATAARLLALERRVTELSSRPAPAPASTPEPTPLPGPDDLPPDAREEQQRFHATFEQMVETALRDPVDSAWASKAGRVLQGELETLRGGEERYRIVSVDCRTRTCLAELDFPNLSDARSQLGKLVMGTNLEGCASTGYISPTEEPLSHSKMRILFDCDRSREARRLRGSWKLSRNPRSLENSPSGRPS